MALLLLLLVSQAGSVAESRVFGCDGPFTADLTEAQLVATDYGLRTTDYGLREARYHPPMKYTLRINGGTHEVEGEPGDSLLSVLRYELGLTGSKYGCGEGFCGACTVLVDGETARSCVVRLGAAAGKAITTIEGLASGDRLHPVQEAFLETEAFQCGYCTPGMVMATIGLLKRTPNPTEQDIAKVMDRNVCRCGTYPRIVDAIKAAAGRMRATDAGGGR